MTPARIDCDLLVVGSGAGGLSAAVTAAHHGLRVIVFIVVSLVVFLIARAMIREEVEAPAEPSDEVRLLTEIRDALRAR